jgi:hypothetical protein
MTSPLTREDDRDRAGHRLHDADGRSLRDNRSQPEPHEIPGEIASADRVAARPARPDAQTAAFAITEIAQLRAERLEER